jgi:hypothetical protein
VSIRAFQPALIDPTRSAPITPDVLHPQLDPIQSATQADAIVEMEHSSRDFPLIGTSCFVNIDDTGTTLLAEQSLTH